MNTEAFNKILEIVKENPEVGRGKVLEILREQGFQRVAAQW